MKTHKSTPAVLWPVHELDRVFPGDAPPRNASTLVKTGWQLAVARDEYCGFQLGIRCGCELSDVKITVEKLRQGKHVIPATAIQIRWVGLIPVPLDAFQPVAAERPELAPAWYPDQLQETAPWRTIHPNRSAAVYLTLHVPRPARAGHYRGYVVVRIPGGEQTRIPIHLDVWPFSLPKRSSFYVANWFQMDCVTKWHRCKPWSERHWRLLDLYAEDMAAHRLNVIITPTLIGNFHNSDPMTLVDIIRKTDGSYKFNMQRLTRWVRLFDKHGFKLFECWHFLAQAHGKSLSPFRLYDEKKGKYIWYESLSSTGNMAHALLSSFLKEFSLWLDRRKLTDRFLLHVFDEPQQSHWPHYARMSALFRKYAPKLRHLDAISTSELLTEFDSGLDIPVPLTTHLNDKDGYFRKRAHDGKKPVWWYTCCGPGGRFANRFVHMPLINGRILFWQSFVYDISGYLHWGYNFWHRTGQDISGWPRINRYADTLLANPYREHPAEWAIGDACIVYPHPRWWEDHGPVGSLRWEAMRAGLQDYELLRLLDTLTRKAASESRTAKPDTLNKARRLLKAVRGPVAGSLTDFTRDAKRLIRTRQLIGECISLF